MSNYANTKAIIAANIYTNGGNEVTAAMVKSAVDDIVDTLIAGGYLYKGVAHPADAAISPDANVFYIATEAGTYTNKGGLVVAGGEVAVLKYNGSWSKDVTDLATKQSLAKKVSAEESINLFDKNNISNGFVSAAGFYPSSSLYMSSPIAVLGGTEYKANFPTSSLGKNDAIAIVTKDGEFISSFRGIVASDYITFTPASDCYIRINAGTIAFADTMMLTESALWPLSYVAHIKEIAPGYDFNSLMRSQLNTLSSRLDGKSVIFTGDSICAGALDTPSGAGWAKRIGEAHGMVWSNLAISGATIIDKNLVGSSGTISDTNFGAGADYIILEGGTNDADRIGSILNGNTPALYGSYDEIDYLTNFTNQTFCGAVEYLLKKVISTFPSARVGFIIAPKMGSGGGGYTPEVNNRRAYFETIINLCRKWGVPVLNLWDECTMNPRLPSHYTPGQDYLYADGQHPTANGYDLMTPIIEAWMETL